MQKPGAFKLVDTVISKFYSSSLSKFYLFFFFLNAAYTKF